MKGQWNMCGLGVGAQDRKSSLGAKLSVAICHTSIYSKPKLTGIYSPLTTYKETSSQTKQMLFHQNISISKVEVNCLWGHSCTWRNLKTVNLHTKLWIYFPCKGLKWTFWCFKFENVLIAKRTIYNRFVYDYPNFLVILVNSIKIVSDD